MNVIFNTRNDPLQLAEHLANDVSDRINKSIGRNGRAVVALSGGSTPKPFFAALAKKDIDWSRVIITLVDERWVDETHELSNAAFMRRHLLNALNPRVRFVPLYFSLGKVEESYDMVLKNYCEATESTTQAPRNFDVVVLGMGKDGHTASFFPDADNINELVDIKNNRPLHACHSPTTQVQRITWSIKMLLNSSFLVLHYTGQEKKQVFDRAKTAGSHTELPIRSVIFQDHVPLNVYYAD